MFSFSLLVANMSYCHILSGCVIWRCAKLGFGANILHPAIFWLAISIFSRPQAWPISNSNLKKQHETTKYLEPVTLTYPHQNAKTIALVGFFHYPSCWFSQKLPLLLVDFCTVSRSNPDVPQIFPSFDGICLYFPDKSRFLADIY